MSRDKFLSALGTVLCFAALFAVWLVLVYYF